MVGAGPASRRAAGRARGALHPRPAGARGGGGRRGSGPGQANPRTSPGGPRAGRAVGRRQWLQWRRQRGASGRSRAPGRQSVLGESGVGSEELRKERSSFRGTLERGAVRHALICIFGRPAWPRVWSPARATQRVPVGPGFGAFSLRTARRALRGITVAGQTDHLWPDAKLRIGGSGAVGSAGSSEQGGANRYVSRSRVPRKAKP